MAALVRGGALAHVARGRRYLLATCSDASGQFVASCFDDEASADVEAAAKLGGCGLMTVELDRRPGEETPRVTIRAIQPLDQLSGTTMLRLEVEIDDAGAVALLAGLLGGAGGGKCEVRLIAALPDGGQAEVRLRERYLLDAELAARIERLPGVTGVRAGGGGAARAGGVIAHVHAIRSSSARTGFDHNSRPCRESRSGGTNRSVRSACASFASPCCRHARREAGAQQIGPRPEPAHPRVIIGIVVAPAGAWTG